MEKITPQTANTYKKICGLKKDNLDYKGWWILVQDNEVSIVQQKKGEKPKQEISISKKILDRFIRFYISGVK